MSEPTTLIDSNTIVTQKPNSHESTVSLAPGDKSLFRRIEFHPARKPFTGFTNGGGDGSFRLETLNPHTTSLKVTNRNQQNVGSDGVLGRKRDASELENVLDPELSFGITFKRIGAGLENLGNTCFLNSVLQCLTYTEPLAAYLQSGKHQVTCRKAGFCALCAIQKHVSRALQSSGRSLAPKDLVSNLRCISRTFRNSRQEDAHEYMVNLLESMHKCCLPNGVPSESQSAYDRSLVHKIFGGRLRSQVKCMQCNYCSNKFDPFLDLSLEILRADTLYKAFANFTAKEQLDGGAKQYQCQQCKQKVKALKQLTIYKPPNVLTVHLKRFGSHMSGQKIDKKIHFGPTLDLKPFVTGPYDGDLKYTLYGVLVHAGWSTHSGHYYCFVRTSSGMWYSLDDNRVFQVSETRVFEQKAYMLFYFKDRKKISTKKTMDVHQKEKIVMNGTQNRPGAQRESQMNTGAHLKEKIVMNGSHNATSASREAQMKTGLTNLSLNAQTSLVTFGTERNGSSSVAPEEIPINTIFSNTSSNGPSPVNTQTNESGVPKEAQMETPKEAQMEIPKEAQMKTPKETQMKTGLSDGPSNAEMFLAAVDTDRNGFKSVLSKQTQTDSNLSNISLNVQKSSNAVGTMTNVHSTGAIEATQKQQASDPKSNSEPCKTEDHTKIIGASAQEIGRDESSGGNSGGDGHMDKGLGRKTNITELLDSSKVESFTEKKAHDRKVLKTDASGLPKMEGSSEKKPLGGKTQKKVKNALKCKIVTMKFSSSVLMGTSLLKQRKKKKHKSNKQARNLGQESLINEESTLSVKTEAQESVKPHVENGLKERVNIDGAVLATSDLNSDPTGSQMNCKESNHLVHQSKSLAQKDLVHMLTIGADDITVPRWDEDESAPFQNLRENTRRLTIGYIGDEWDEDYDRGKRKKVRTSKTEFNGMNPFQDIANERLKSHLGKQNLSKRPSMIKKKNNKHSKKPRFGNVPFRI